MCERSCSPCCRWLLLHLILPHFSSLVSKTLATCTSSPLQKAPQARGGLPTSIKYFSLSLFVFSRTGSRFNQTPALLSTVHQIHSEHPLSSHTRRVQHISVAAAPITRDLLSRYLHNPHGSTLQPPGGTASCEEQLFNLGSSWSFAVTLCLSECNI